MTVNTKSAEHEKKTTAPRPKRKGKPVQFYAEDDFLAAVEAWRATQRPIPSMSEALRFLVETNPRLAGVLQEKTAAGLEAAKKGKKR